eukprot:4156977-Pyramimonas_sp.AAC.1
MSQVPSPQPLSPASAQLCRVYSARKPSSIGNLMGNPAGSAPMNRTVTVPDARAVGGVGVETFPSDPFAPSPANTMLARRRPCSSKTRTREFSRVESRAGIRRTNGKVSSTGAGRGSPLA